MGELVLNQAEGKEFFTIKMVYFRPYPNIPAFQYSIIPWKWHKPGAIKKSLISINCRISETFNQGGLFYAV